MDWKAFYPHQKRDDQKKYLRLLLGASQASRLFSTNSKPFIHYRTAENIFCKAFSATNVSRQDCSVDAVKLKDGIGVKTFLSNGIRKYEKVAEFNDKRKYRIDYTNKLRMIKQIAFYRNKRLKDTDKKYQLKNCSYHYLVRDVRKLLICECPMLPIEEKRITLKESPSQHIVKFADGLFLYHFHTTKNTLYKAFLTNEPFETVKVPSRVDEALLLETLRELTPQKDEFKTELLTATDYVVLPLYSTITEEVPEKSGLNQWNAGGRKRDLDEVYIPIPKIIHDRKKDFFPKRNHKFTLKTQDGREFFAKVCQDNSKALMTDPNKDLGKWLLRDILGLPKGKIVTSDDLKRKGADTVIIYKVAKDEYQISLHSFGGFVKEYGVISRKKS